MIQASASGRIAAPAERVFEFMNHPPNQADILPSLVESTETGRMPGGGAKASYLYKMPGVRLRGQVEAVEWVPGERIVFAMTGDMQGEIRQLFAAEGGTACRMTYAVDYAIPGSVLARIAEPVIARYNQRELESAVANLRERLEA